MRPMTAEEAWKHILDNHSMYHKDLKKYGYTYKNFIPNVDIIKEMFEKENHPSAESMLPEAWTIMIVPCHRSKAKEK